LLLIVVAAASRARNRAAVLEVKIDDKHCARLNTYMFTKRIRDATLRSI
jgi:hypothetical protein